MALCAGEAHSATLLVAKVACARNNTSGADLHPGDSPDGLACPGETNRDRICRCGSNCVQLFDYLNDGTKHHSGCKRCNSISHARLSHDFCAWDLAAG
jgi:hypothetical protein